ncbi:hypothetical protein CRE_23526 [Caenorhabditis remanei]|uniref:Uncharacterized protein n=1 Tax=Caenorhabditis remanei TaxID=31234 RepID=E3MH65_CAERE|nr:hypothetical protein CRE_23526 [Caenorhabditis remanei]
MSTPDSDIISDSKCTSCRKPLGNRKILTLTEQQWKICKPCYKKLYGDMKKTEQYKLEANMKKMIIGVKVLVTSQTICGVPECTNELVFGKAFMNQELQKRTCISCYGKLYRQRTLKIEAEKVRKCYDKLYYKRRPGRFLLNPNAPERFCGIPSCRRAILQKRAYKCLELQTLMCHRCYIRIYREKKITSYKFFKPNDNLLCANFDCKKLLIEGRISNSIYGGDVCRSDTSKPLSQHRDSVIRHTRFPEIPLKFSIQKLLGLEETRNF